MAGRRSRDPKIGILGPPSYNYEALPACLKREHSGDSGYASLNICPNSSGVFYTHVDEDLHKIERSSLKHNLCEDGFTSFQTDEDVVHHISGMPIPVGYIRPCVSKVSKSNNDP